MSYAFEDSELQLTSRESRSFKYLMDFMSNTIYLASLTAVYSLFILPIIAAGLSSIRWILITTTSQIFVAKGFGEIVFRYLIPGRLDPWTRILWKNMLGFLHESVFVLGPSHYVYSRIYCFRDYRNLFYYRW